VAFQDGGRQVAIQHQSDLYYSDLVDFFRTQSEMYPYITFSTLHKKLSALFSVFEAPPPPPKDGTRPSSPPPPPAMEAEDGDDEPSMMLLSLLRPMIR